MSSWEWSKSFLTRSSGRFARSERGGLRRQGLERVMSYVLLRVWTGGSDQETRMKGGVWWGPKGCRMTMV